MKRTFVVTLGLLLLTSAAQAQTFTNSRNAFVCLLYKDAYTVREMAIAGNFRSADYPRCIWIPPGQQLTLLQRHSDHFYGALRTPNGELLRVWTDQSDWTFPR